MSEGAAEQVTYFVRELGDVSSAASAEVVRVLRNCLDKQKPAQVMPSDTVVVGVFPTACIFVVPHHWCAGVALLVWSENRREQGHYLVVGWTVVDAKSLEHPDELDLGSVSVGHLQVGRPGWEQLLTQRITLELQRPIEVLVSPTLLHTLLHRMRIEWSISVKEERHVLARQSLRDDGRFGVEQLPIHEHTALAAPLAPRFSFPASLGTREGEGMR